MANPRPPWWLVFQDGWARCRLCDVWVSKARRHALTKKHVAKENARDRVGLSTPETGEMPTVPASWGDPSHFEWRETPEFDACWCKLCSGSKCVDMDHICSAEHVKKAALATGALLTPSASSPAASPSFVPVPAFLDAPPEPTPTEVEEGRTAFDKGTWKSVWSHEHNRYYYYCVETHETSWSISHSREERLKRAQDSEFRVDVLD